MSASKKSCRRWARASVACLRNALPLLLAASFAAAAAGEIYRWKDSAGQWHYGDQPPADQQAEQVAVRAAPGAGASTPIDPALSPDGMPVQSEPVKPVAQPRTVREVQRGCATIINACVTQKGVDRGQCLADVRQCAADPTLEKQDCCPAACGIRYAALKAAGLPDGLAFSRAVFSAPSCVPGADDLPAQ